MTNDKQRSTRYYRLFNCWGSNTLCFTFYFSMFITFSRIMNNVQEQPLDLSMAGNKKKKKKTSKTPKAESIIEDLYEVAHKTI